MHISIDMGGTSTKIASSKNLNDIYKFDKFATNHKLSTQKQKIKKVVQNLLAGDGVESICLGVPGILDKKNRIFKNIVNYPYLNNKPFEFIFDLADQTKNLYVENDAALAGLGEANRGEASKFNNVCYLTLSTGVGGVQILNKKLSDYQNTFEPGHMIIIEDGLYDDICGQKGCLHAYLSGAMFEKAYFCADKKVKVCQGGRPEDTKSKDIWNLYGKHLATGIINIMAMWSPDIIVIGGSITNKWDLFISATLNKLGEQNLFDLPKIVRSTLEDKNGILGGFDLISRNY